MMLIGVAAAVVARAAVRGELIHATMALRAGVPVPDSIRRKLNVA